jgi:hypothetical protein
MRRRCGGACCRTAVADSAMVASATVKTIGSTRSRNASICGWYSSALHSIAGRNTIVGRAVSSLARDTVYSNRDRRDRTTRDNGISTNLYDASWKGLSRNSHLRRHRLEAVVAWAAVPTKKSY